MAVTIWGPVADELGHSQWDDTITHRGPGGRLVVEVRHRYGVLRCDQFRSSQPAHIGMDFGSHGAGQCGEVVYLEQQGRHLIAVAVMNLEPGDLEAAGPLKFSTLTKHPRSGDNVELVSIAVVKSADAATVALPTVEWIDGDVRAGALAQIGIGQQPAILKRAREYNLDRGRSQPIMICRPDLLDSIEYVSAERGWDKIALVNGEPIGIVKPPPLKLRRPSTDVDDQLPPGHGPLEYRRGRILAVR